MPESDFKADLVRSYDWDAPARNQRTLPDERVELRERFVELLRAENRKRLIEFGAIPIAGDALGNKL